MEQRKKCLSSPSLRTRFPSPRAAVDCPCVPWRARGRLVRTPGVPTDRPANRHYSPPPRSLAPAPDCPGSRHHSAASRAASAAAAHADILPPRNTSDRELASMAERPCRTRHTAAPPSMRLRSAKLSEVRYRPAVNRFFTNSRKRQKLRWLSIQWLHSGEHRWVNSGERQGRRPHGRVQVELREADLASWMQTPFRRQRQNPRDVLLAAMTDFSNSALASRAVAFYDDPQQFEEFLGKSRISHRRTAVRSRSTRHSSQRAIEAFKYHARELGLSPRGLTIGSLRYPSVIALGVLQRSFAVGRGNHRALRRRFGRRDNQGLACWGAGCRPPMLRSRWRSSW